MGKSKSSPWATIMDRFIDRDYSRAEVRKARKEHDEQVRKRREASWQKYKDLCRKDYPELFNETE